MTLHNSAPNLNIRTGIAVLAVGALAAAGIANANRGPAHQPAPQEAPLEVDHNLASAWDQADEMANKLHSTIGTDKTVEVQLLNGYINKPYAKQPDLNYRYDLPVFFKTVDNSEGASQWIGTQTHDQGGRINVIPAELDKTKAKIVLNDPTKPVITVQARAFEDPPKRTVHIPRTGEGPSSDQIIEELPVDPYSSENATRSYSVYVVSDADINQKLFPLGEGYRSATSSTGATIPEEGLIPTTGHTPANNETHYIFKKPTA